MAVCKSCQRPIVWTRTENGKRMPVDEQPAGADVHAGFVLRGRGSSEGPLAVAVTRDQMPGEPIYVSHFATCPQADSWRRS